MTWIRKTPLFKGQRISLISLERSHFDNLIGISKDKRIWSHYAIDGSDTNKLTSSLEDALIEKEKGIQYPFCIVLQTDKKIIGSTRFLDILPEHKKLEIGWTWLHPNYWGTNINLECKFHLLTYCFEELLTKRVQLKTDETNIRSRKAIEKIGGQFEGILRNDMIRDNGTSRNSAYYSITDNEWVATKKNLLKMMKSK
ncbi:MAG: GNAT family protein [Bacteroidia bacterium]